MLHWPGPMVPTTTPMAVRTMTYSQPSPGRKMKKPFFRWLVIQATTMTPTTPAPASGVSSPSTSRPPAPISTRLAIQAWRIPGRMPNEWNQRPVPSILPPP